MSVPDPNYVLRVPDHSPVSSLQHQEDENYLFSGHQNGTILVRFCVTGRLSNRELVYANCFSNASAPVLGSFTLAESEIFLLIFTVARCEQRIGFPKNPSGSYVAFAQCEWALENFSWVYC